MRYNKGFIGIGVIIAVIAAIVIGGGVVYYAAKAPAPSFQEPKISDYYQLEDTKVPTQPPVAEQAPAPTAPSSQQNTCSPNDPPSVTVISPNGEEVYQIGQQITL